MCVYCSRMGPCLLPRCIHCVSGGVLLTKGCTAGVHSVVEYSLMECMSTSPGWSPSSLPFAGIFFSYHGASIEWVMGLTFHGSKV